MKNIGVHHYQTKYRNENDDLVAVSWIQVDFLKWRWCFSVKELEMPKPKKTENPKDKTILLIRGLETSLGEFKKALEHARRQNREKQEV